MSDTSAKIIPFGRGLLARRGTGTIVRQHPSGTNSLCHPSGAELWPSPDVARRRLASLTAATRRVPAKALLKVIHDRAAQEGWSARQISDKTGLSRMALPRLARGELDLVVWLPKLAASVAKLDVVGRTAPRAPHREEIAP